MDLILDLEQAASHEGPKPLLEETSKLQKIYGDLPPIASVLVPRRARFAGHCMRVADQTISTILPWRLRQAGRAGRPLTFLDTVARDVGLEIGDPRGAMLDSEIWRKIVEESRGGLVSIESDRRRELLADNNTFDLRSQDTSFFIQNIFVRSDDTDVIVFV